MIYKWYNPEKLTDYSCKILTFCSYCLLSCQHTPTPICMLMFKFIGACALGANIFTSVSVLMMKYGVALLRAIRLSAIFTQHEAYVHCGKPWSASDTPTEN